jgi:hypothetical protein
VAHAELGAVALNTGRSTVRLCSGGGRDLAESARGLQPLAAPTPAIAFAGAGLLGIGTAAFTSHLFPLYLLQTPEGMLARFQSVLLVAQMLAMLIGNAWLGGLASQVGPGQAMLAAASACACAGIPILASRTLRNARM